jgi:hypothetical protein
MDISRVALLVAVGAAVIAASFLSIADNLQATGLTNASPGCGRGSFFWAARVLSAFLR